MPSKDALFKDRAKYIKRDIKAGVFTDSDIPELIRGDWEKDSDEYSDAYGVKSFEEFRQGVKSHLGKAPKKATKKAKPKGKKKVAKKKRKSSWWPW